MEKDCQQMMQTALNFEPREELERFTMINRAKGENEF